MPKGALLHAHLDATVNARLLLKFALEHPCIHIRLSRPLTITSITTTIPEFRPLTAASSALSLTSDGYVPGEWVPIVKARDSFHENFGGPEGFDKWIVDALMINPSEAYEQYNTTNKVTFLCYREYYLILMDGSYPDLEEVPKYIRRFLCKSVSNLYKHNDWNDITVQVLIRYKPIWRKYIYEFLSSSVDDGISYIEARINFHYK